jgi:Zn-dependent protease
MDPRKGMAIVGAAGPLTNFFLAAVFALIYRAASISLPTSWSAMSLSNVIGLLLVLIVQINLLLGLLNLIPIPPLDGFRIAVGLLPQEPAISFAEMERYATTVILIFAFFLIFTGFLGGPVGWLTNTFLGQKIY